MCGAGRNGGGAEALSIPHEPCCHLRGVPPVGAVCLQDAAAAGRAGRMERRWAAILGPGTWPEVLRRYALTRSGAGPPGAQQGAELAVKRALQAVGRTQLGVAPTAARGPWHNFVRTRGVALPEACQQIGVATVVLIVGCCPTRLLLPIASADSSACFLNSTCQAGHPMATV